jgi:hypothetical protein
MLHLRFVTLKDAHPYRHFALKDPTFWDWRTDFDINTYHITHKQYIPILVLINRQLCSWALLCCGIWRPVYSLVESRSGLPCGALLYCSEDRDVKFFRNSLIFYQNVRRHSITISHCHSHVIEKVISCKLSTTVMRMMQLALYCTSLYISCAGLWYNTRFEWWNLASGYDWRRVWSGHGRQSMNFLYFFCDLGNKLHHEHETSPKLATIEYVLEDLRIVNTGVT